MGRQIGAGRVGRDCDDGPWRRSHPTHPRGLPSGTGRQPHGTPRPLPQLYSRIGFVHQYRSLNPTELARVIRDHWPHLGLDTADPASAETIAAITRSTSDNFRLVARILAQAQRIAAINAARDALVIGTA